LLVPMGFFRPLIVGEQYPAVVSCLCHGGTPLC
jgi:hypothetical protein